MRKFLAQLCMIALIAGCGLVLTACPPAEETPAEEAEEMMEEGEEAVDEAMDEGEEAMDEAMDEGEEMMEEGEEAMDEAMDEGEEMMEEGGGEDDGGDGGDEQ